MTTERTHDPILWSTIVIAPKKQQQEKDCFDPKRQRLRKNINTQIANKSRLCISF